MPAEGLTRGTAAVAAALLLTSGLGLVTAGPAAADTGDRDGTADSTPTPDSGGDTVSTQIKYEVSDTGSSGTPMTSAKVDWSPPPCWFEPKYTNKTLDEHNEKLHEDPMSGVNGEVLERRKQETAAHKGEKGYWYERTPVMSPRSCEIGELWVWVPEGDPDPPADVVDPEILAGLAYKQIKLPKPPVELSPSGDKQKVNLETQVKFGKNLDRAWATATLDNDDANVHIAATTVAEPYQLKIDAGTDSAAPRTCTYKLDKGDGGYKVNSANEDCNVTYQRSSRGGTYPLSAQLVWKVTWNQTDGPDGPAEAAPELPNGVSVYEQDVTVKEVQTVTR
ncbi:hypothetical protein [Streptomyces boninensis]|uniref:hypothetical protein n=1 Tax=Streptomyces boninensis TaxID=2039455 RepID=UPI003B21C425